MKRFSKTLLGVTLLEIMLVLAVAAMIIVMSVRYYQSASANQQANAMLQQLQAITAIADGIAQSGNGYSGVSTGAVEAMMPNQNLTTPWGTGISISPGTTSYTVSTSGTPKAICPQLKPRLETNARFGTVTCDTSGNFSYTYDATKG